MDAKAEHVIVIPEAWAEAQVNAVAVEVEKRTKRKGKKEEPPAKVRGVFFRPNANGQVKDHLGRLGDWWCRYTDLAGMEHREKAGSRPAAIDLYGRRRSEVRQGKQFPESLRNLRKASLAEVCHDYLVSLAANGRDARGQAAFRLSEVQSILGAVAAETVTPQEIEKLKAKLAETPARGRKDPQDPKKERPRAPGSANRYLQDLRAAFNVARRNGKVEKNPVGDVRLLRENNKRVREITADEEKAILTALDPQERRFHTDLRPMVKLLLETGLRAGEACRLRWPDVDWRAEVATLPKTKAGAAQHAALNAAALAILRALGPQGDGYVFAWKGGRPWTVGYLTHAFHKAALKAAVVDVHPHDCRHTFACRRLRAGVDIFAVSKLLRHASVTMSERYAHLSQADLKAAVERASPTPTGTPTGT
ncbi:MAG: site-specific integrase [candidate division NC10 bacterium]|nr:site-specific integrase [candidate division NC10 bacterium]